MDEYKGKVLLVEDQSALRDLFRQYLEISKYEAVAVGDGKAALGQLSQDFGLIISDFDYNFRDEFLQHVNRNYPILLITGRSPEDAEILKLMESIEVCGVLQKSYFSRKQFADAVELHYRAFKRPLQ